MLERCGELCLTKDKLANGKWAYSLSAGRLVNAMLFKSPEEAIGQAYRSFTNENRK